MRGYQKSHDITTAHKLFIASPEEYCHDRRGFLGRKLEEVRYPSPVEASNPVKLHNHQNAVVNEHKLSVYLLSSSHAYGRHKGAFFKRFGSSADAWQTLAQALLEHASQNEVVQIEDSPFGKRYIIEGELEDTCSNAKPMN